MSITRTTKLAASLAGALALAAAAFAQPAAKPFPIADALADKVLPLAGLIEHDAPARAAIAGDPELSTIASAWRGRIADAPKACGVKADCHIAAGRLTPDEVERIEQALRRLAADNAAVKRFSDGPLRASGVAALADASSAPDRLAAAWRTASKTMANMISVYGESGPTRYPAIDAMRNDPKSPAFGVQMRTLVLVEGERAKAGQSFLAGPADFALGVMLSDGRDEAARYEPMEKGENRAAFERMRKLKWSAYPYSAILVPGRGPDEADVRLHPGARLRLRLALERFHAGKAPFIIVSGGHVHPNRTPFCEAIEMKRALMQDYGVPESAILIDPHARHTTTNVRNAVRLLARYGAPMDRKVLIVTDEGQSSAIASPAFDIRNRIETGIVPYSAKTTLSPIEVEVTPSFDALELNPSDPLDP